MEEISILVVEDKKEDAQFLEESLTAEGYKVWVAPDGKSAIELARTISFAVMVAELHMTGMNGIEVMKTLFKLQPNVSVIVMTAYTFINGAVQAMEEGAYGYITKPFNSAEIKIVLKRAVERHALLSSDKEKQHFVELSIKDGLTGVYNRLFLKMYLLNKIAMVKSGATAETFSLLMIDLDHFKKYNDANGHLAGDDLLCKVAKLFQQSVRQEDMVFRYGGEEFILYLINADKESAALIAERIRSLVALYTPVTISIGVGTVPNDGEEVDVVLSKVDMALYRAKEEGRNRVYLV